VRSYEIYPNTDALPRHALWGHGSAFPRFNASESKPLWVFSNGPRKWKGSMANCYFAKPHGMQHCYIPFLYVIDFKGALNFGEAQVYVARQWHSLSSFQTKRYGILRGSSRLARTIHAGMTGICSQFSRAQKPRVRRQQRRSAPRLCRAPRSDALSPARWRCASRAYPRWDSASRSHEWFAGSARPSP
jgi:hypothetical protein